MPLPCNFAHLNLRLFWDNLPKHNMATATVSKTQATRDWAADEDEDEVLPAPRTVKNKDGTETQISYYLNDAGKKVKMTRIVKRTTVRHEVNHNVAERRNWAKFGLEAGRPAGPHSDTTSMAENIDFRPRMNYKSTQVAEDSDIFANQKSKLKEAKIKCRICSGEHWTNKCPYKATMAPEGEPGAGLGDTAPLDDGPAAGALGGGGSSYVPPHLRKGGAATGERMSGGKYGERDDLATLRVTNVSEFAEESELREMFGRFGHVTRVFLAKDRETGRAKGFAFVSFANRSDAAKACEKMDGFGYGHLILKVEFAKKST